MTQKMSKVRYMRIIFMFMALFMGAASETLAQTSLPCESDGCNFSIDKATDIIIAGNGDVSVTGIVHNTTEGEHNGEHTVTIKVEPDEGYCIKKGDIRVQKLVAPSSRSNPARRNAPAIADYLTVNGLSLVTSSTSDANKQFTFTVPADYDGAYIELEFKSINSLYSGTIITEGGITYDENGHYIILDDVDASTIFAEPQLKAFKGTFEGVAKEDGTFPKIIGLERAIFDSINGGTVKNIMLDNVDISSGTNVGAICNEAKGASRIYNCGVLATNSTAVKDEDGYTKITSCSSTISGSGYVGGIVGLLDGSSRVINCFSYADVSGGTNVGGIVGYNNQTTTSANNNQKTMVMNCMFYGDITGGTTKSPIYGGTIISNAGSNGVGNYNYFRLEAPYVQPTGITYNCALGAEDRYLQRFEFYRHLLNSHRELAAWWASTPTDSVTKSEIMKWFKRYLEKNKKTALLVMHNTKDPNQHRQEGLAGTADFARMATKVIETRNEGFLPKVGTGTTATMPGSLLSVELWSARGVDQWRFAPLVLKAIKNPNHKGVKISELDGSDYQKINKLLNENAPDKKQRELWWSQRDLANLFNSGDVDE